MSDTAYLVINDTEDNFIANSIILTNHGDDVEFLTTDRSTPNDIVSNCMSYNYDNYDLDFINPIVNVIDPIPNTNPDFLEAPDFDWAGTPISEIMENLFIPKPISPVLDKGENSYVGDIDTDIIGNPRIYLSGLVDIGPYELLIHQLLFYSEDIQSIFQDKLRFDYSNKRYVPVAVDDIYSDLYNQFWDQPSYREEFSRESKVVIKLKRVYKDVLFFSDKKNIDFVEYEAYYDMGAQSIIVVKTDENLGSMLSGIFDNGRYVFYFDEAVHKLFVYLNPTYNKGKSGKGNVVNNVRLGGVSILND